MVRTTYAVGLTWQPVISRRHRRRFSCAAAVIILQFQLPSSVDLQELVDQFTYFTTLPLLAGWRAGMLVGWRAGVLAAAWPAFLPACLPTCLPASLQINLVWH